MITNDIIYIVTGFEKLEPIKFGIIDTGDTRCFGWFADFQSAEIAVKDNLYDINEAGSYPYVVIEASASGIYSSNIEDRQFYRFDDITKRYKPIAEPEELKRICGFGIG